MAQDQPQLRRHDPGVVAADDLRALRDPAVQRAIAQLERGIIIDIANDISNGSPEQDALDLERCRELRVITKLKRQMGAQPQMQQLRDAAFKPHAPEEGD